MLALCKEIENKAMSEPGKQGGEPAPKVRQLCSFAFRLRMAGDYIGRTEKKKPLLFTKQENLTPTHAQIFR